MDIPFHNQEMQILKWLFLNKIGSFHKITILDNYLVAGVGNTVHGLWPIFVGYHFSSKNHFWEVLPATFFIFFPSTHFENVNGWCSIRFILVEIHFVGLWAFGLCCAALFDYILTFANFSCRRRATKSKLLPQSLFSRLIL